MTPQYDGMFGNVPLDGGIPYITELHDAVRLDIVCPGCQGHRGRQETVGRVTETDRGPLLWLWHNDRGGHLPPDEYGRGPETAHVRWRFLDGNEETGLGRVPPDEIFAERCPYDGALEVTGGDIFAGLALRRERIVVRRASTTPEE